MKNRGSSYHAYAILSMCRSLYALEHGTIVSKSAAAKWAQLKFGDQWHLAIERALSMQAGTEDFDLFPEAAALIQFTLERVGTN